jgi:dipeptidyl aminopeptidase/acylaminoacyl peptidase
MNMQSIVSILGFIHTIFKVSICFIIKFNEIIDMQKICKLPFLAILLTCSFLNLSAQDNTGYQVPPKVIADLLLAPPTPSISVNNSAKYMLVMERNSYPSVEELGQPELKIAGLRINPLNASLTRQTYINRLVVKQIDGDKNMDIKGLPANLSALSPVWNPAENKIAFFNVLSNRVDVYVIDITTLSCKKINTSSANLVLGNTLIWVDDNNVLYKANANDPAKVALKPITPKGPTIQENLGKVAPSVTYQDLIKSPFDEYLFEYFTTVQLVKNNNGVETKIGKPSVLSSVSISPNKQYFLTRTLNKPFSYLVTFYGFASTVEITDSKGNLVHTLASLPSTENTPSGYDNVQNTARGFDWRNDQPASIVYAMPLDSGYIKKKVPFHDAVFALEAPFNGTPKELFKTENRYSRTNWGNDQVALVSEQLRSKQQYKVSLYNSKSNTISTLYEGNSTDMYNNPGNPVTEKNSFGEEVLAISKDGQTIMFNNTTGASAKGDLPYLAKFNIQTKSKEILWRSAEDCFEYVADVLDINNLKVITRRETEKEVPNYFIREGNTLAHSTTLTKFTNPYSGMDGVTKEKIKYKRKDGIDMTGDLYLPKGYDKLKDGPLPTLIWAYPREFTNAADASQIRGNQHKFTMLSWATPVFYVTQGYAILDNAEMPIVATSPDKKPNDDFVNQLGLNASAAIDKLVEMGVGDRNRMAVGGHSYGAFMTANLLAHTNLFKTGIARSGAYNRTLTPFGFQNEERTFWQAPQLYLGMSPFAFADKIKAPILLTHGEMDDNTGTFPINSERLYAAIKGHGGTTRFVYLPYEAHSYRGKENLLHLLYEQGRWLDKYLK